MTNTKFRKRALLSSVAMLLVALIALGSATFAWFVANPNATAKGLSLKTTASAGLVIRTETDTTYSHNALLGVADASTITGTGLDRTATFLNFNLTPASEDQGTNKGATFYTVQASDAADEAADPDQKVMAATAGRASNDVYAEKVYFKYSDGSNAADGTVNLTGVTITSDAAATMEGCIRVSVVNNAGTIIGTYALSSAQDNKAITATTEKPITTGSTLFKNVATEDFIALNKTLTDGTAKAVEVEAGTVSTTEKEANSVTVYVWLDGQDADCYSDKVGTVNAAKIISSIQLDFALDT